jgi:hypothetical protein
MTRHITNSLIDKVEWLQNCPDSWKQKAYTDLSNMLNRIYSDETPFAIQRGLAYEKRIQSTCDNALIPSNKIMSTFVDHCKGGTFQKSLTKIITIDKQEYCLSGKIDVLFDNHIIDIKTTGNYKGKASYLSKAQHLIYCLCTGIKTFDYLVAEFYNDADTEPSAFHKVSYEVSDFSKVREEVIDRVTNTINFIKTDNELWNAYTKKFCY